MRKETVQQCLEEDLQVTFPEGGDHPFRPQTTASYACIGSAKAVRRSKASEVVNGMVPVDEVGSTGRDETKRLDNLCMVSRTLVMRR